MNRNPSPSPVTWHVWASEHRPDEPPTRLLVTICPRCSALVIDVAVHAAHHAEVTR